MTTQGWHWTTTVLLAAALTLTGCATQTQTGTDTATRNAVTLPTQWRQAHLSTHETDLSRDWWRGFGNTELNDLVELAQVQSLDIAAAVARVRQAEASLRIAGAPLWPEVNASIEAGRQGRIGGDADVTGNRFTAGLAASYELDFWGGRRATRDSAYATWQASTFDHDTVRLTVTAAVATAWLQAVALRERIDIGNANLHSAERLLALIASRSQAGEATPLELAQQRGLVAAQRRNLAALQHQADDARTALAVLLGQTGDVAIHTPSLAALNAPAIAPGLPTALLVRRPDVARAEASLASAEADVHAARAAMLPSVALTATIGTGGDRLRHVLDNPLYSLATALAAPIFNAGRLAAGHDLAQARRQALLADYRQTIVAAFRDVEIALSAAVGIHAQQQAQTEERLQARQALTLAESRYRAGEETLLVLLDAQRTLYAAQDATVLLQLEKLAASVALYKALGGGWQAQSGA